MDRRCPRLEDTGAAVTVVNHVGFNSTYDKMAWRMLDVWADVWRKHTEPRHEWFVRLWDDSAVWVEGMARELAGSEMLPCCSSDRAVAISQPPTPKEKFRGQETPYIHGGAPLILSREAMRRLMQGEPDEAFAGHLNHKAWATARCSDGTANPSMCKQSEDMLVSFALLRSGVRFRFSTGVSAHSTSSRSGKLPLELDPQRKCMGAVSAPSSNGTRPGFTAQVVCGAPVDGQLARVGEAVGIWATHYVPGHEQQGWVDAMRASCSGGDAQDMALSSCIAKTEGTGLADSDLISGF